MKKIIVVAETGSDITPEKAAELGCKNSHWMNTHGLHDAEHYTTVRDMAIIGAAAFQYEKFREIINTYQYTIPETSITAEKRYVHQNHKMIRDWDDRYYEYCVGGKTGYTDQALTTLITFATKGDMNLVAVVMRTHGGGNNAYADTREMLEYGFNNFTKIPVSKEIIEDQNVDSWSEGAYFIVPVTETGYDNVEILIKEPSLKGEREGTVEFYYADQLVGNAEITITEERYNEIHGVKESKSVKKQENNDGMPLILKIFIWIVVIIIILIGALVVWVYFKRKELEKRRRLRRIQQMKQRELE